MGGGVVGDRAVGYSAHDGVVGGGVVGGGVRVAVWSQLCIVGGGVVGDSVV